MAPSVPTHNENHNYHDPSNTCIHDMDHAHANTVTPIFVPKAISLPDISIRKLGVLFRHFLSDSGIIFFGIDNKYIGN